MLGSFFYFVVWFGFRFLEISKIKEPLFPFLFTFKIQYPYVLGF